MSKKTIPMKERIDICKAEYMKGMAFKDYVDRYLKKEPEKNLNMAFSELIIYNVCMYYKEKRKVNG